MAAQQASTTNGGAARLGALRSLTYLERSIVYLYRATLARARGAVTLAKTLANRSLAEAEQAERHAKAAVSLFRQAGLNPKPV